MLPSIPVPEPVTSYPPRKYGARITSKKEAARDMSAGLRVLIKARVSLWGLCGLRVIYIAGGRRGRAPPSCAGEPRRLQHVRQ